MFKKWVLSLHLLYFDSNLLYQLRLRESALKNAFMIHDFAVHDRCIDVFLGRSVDDGCFRIEVREGFEMPRIKEGPLTSQYRLFAAVQIVKKFLETSIGCVLHDDNMREGSAKSLIIIRREIILQRNTLRWTLEVHGIGHGLKPGGPTHPVQLTF